MGSFYSWQLKRISYPYYLGGNAPGVTSRLNKLGINNVFMGAHDKRELLLNYMTENKLGEGRGAVYG